jgi:hypothetical protein
VRRICLVLVSFVLSYLNISGADAEAGEPLLISGTHLKGTDFTEPRPKRSQFLETVDGGIAIIGEKAGFYLFTKVIKKPVKELYVVAEYQNPSGGGPLWNKGLFKPTSEELRFGSPDFVKGLRIYSNYTITIKIFESRALGKPIDVLKQTIRSYVDTRGPKVLMHKEVKQRM